MPNWQATALALVVAVAFYLFGMQWRPRIILVTVLTLIFFGMRYLHRNPLAFIILPAFLRGGLLGARR